MAGYLASALVLATFSMKEMRWLRLTAMSSNCAFIFYAIIAHLQPILVLHCILLPVNVFRLMQIQVARLVGRRLLDEAAVDTSLGQPRFLSHTALADPATAILLAEHEQERVARLLSARLPHEGAASPAISPSKTGEAAIHLLAEINQFLAAAAGAEPTQEQVNLLADLHSRNGLLGALHETLGELDAAIDAVSSHELRAVAATIVQGLGAVLLCVEDAAASHAPEDIDLVLKLTADRSELVEQIRTRWIAQQAGGSVSGYHALYTITALYERIVWLLRRYAVLLRAPQAAPHARSADTVHETPT